MEEACLGAPRESVCKVSACRGGEPFDTVATDAAGPVSGYTGVSDRPRGMTSTAAVNVATATAIIANTAVTAAAAATVTTAAAAATVAAAVVTAAAAAVVIAAAAATPQ